MDLKIREDKIKEKRKQTPWRDFVKNICSRRTFSFYKTDDLISIYPKNGRINSIVTVKNFLENQDNLLWLGINHSWNFFNDFQKLFLSIPLSNVLLLGGCENSNYSDQSRNSKNAYLSYILANSENILYSLAVKDNSKNILNSINVVNSENIYQWLNIALSYNIFYSKHIDNCNNLRFCTNMIWCSNCILCDKLENKSYCIHNKQYTKEAYEQLVPRIIEHMQNTLERGEFFPASISPFDYNESLSQEYYPLEKEEAIKQWFTRRDKKYEINIPDNIQLIDTKDIPNINEINDDILKKAIICEVTWRPFRIIKLELDYYKKNNISIPNRHPDQRHYDRLSLRNPRKLFNRQCNKCWIDIITTYKPENIEIIYCENCYNKEIYW